MGRLVSRPTTITVSGAGTSINVAADWLARKSSPGVVWSENWSSFANAAAAYQSPGCWGANVKPDDPKFSNVFEIITDPSRVLSGKAMRVKWSKQNAEGNWILMLGGNKNNIPANYFQKFYVQMVLRADIMDYSFKENGGSQGTPKLCIIDYHNSSSNAGEFVLVNQNCQGFVSAYTRHANGASNTLSKGINTPFNSNNFQMQNAIDRGGTLSDQNSYERRYGPTVYGMSGTSNLGSKLSQQGTPDPDAKVAGAHWNIGGFITLMCEVQLNPNRARYWWAPYNPAAPVAPILVGDTNLCAPGEHLFGTRNDGTGTGWSGLQLTNYTTNAGDNNSPTENWTDWAEIIFSTQAIPFPGGLKAPGV